MDLDWELGVFHLLRALWRRLAPAPSLPYNPETVVFLADVQAKLQVVASVMAGQPVRVLPARTDGGIRQGDLLLPPYLDLGPSVAVNTELYIQRAAVGAVLLRRPPSPTGDAIQQTFALWKNAAEALDELDAYWPTLRAQIRAAAPLWLAHRHPPSSPGAARLEALLPDIFECGSAGIPNGTEAALHPLAPSSAPPSPCALWGEWVPVTIAGTATPSENIDSVHPPNDATTDIEAPPIEALHVVLADPNRVTELPVHAFEKVETVEAFTGTMRQMDGSDELQDHVEALSEVNLSHLLRGGPATHSLYHADLQWGVSTPDVGTIEPGETAVPYDEWDQRNHRYLPNWCQVYPSPVASTDPGWCDAPLRRNDGLIRRMTEQVLARQTRYRPRTRQLHGHDVDIDALVADHAAVRAGRERNPRVYLRRQRDAPELAVTVLLDISLSADSWVQGHRVLDLTREATLVLGEVAHRSGHDLQVLAFASHTRNRVRVWTVRDWNEPWSTGRVRLGGLRPQGYTRIGPAIRHATVGLSQVAARERWLLLLTDGKPNDEDRYEGHHGIADVRRAIREAHDCGIHTHALAVDRVARDYLPQMLGPGAWSIVPHADGLSTALANLYVRQVSTGI